MWAPYCSQRRAQSPLCEPGNVLLEADGLCLNSKLVVLNEAKATPTSFDVNGLTKRGLLLKLILASRPIMRPSLPKSSSCS